ncbi:hypothetical protein HDE_06762 [Halotydeus destructor]|nr:hypothetical protein HDE_06762 [Halotydeus destructor]
MAPVNTTNTIKRLRAANKDLTRRVSSLEAEVAPLRKDNNTLKGMVNQFPHVAVMEAARERDEEAALVETDEWLLDRLAKFWTAVRIAEVGTAPQLHDDQFVMGTSMIGRPRPQYSGGAFAFYAGMAGYPKIARYTLQEIQDLLPGFFNFKVSVHIFRDYFRDKRYRLAPFFVYRHAQQFFNFDQEARALLQQVDVVKLQENPEYFSLEIPSEAIEEVEEVVGLLMDGGYRSPAFMVDRACQAEVLLVAESFSGAAVEPQEADNELEEAAEQPDEAMELEEADGDPEAASGVTDAVIVREEVAAQKNEAEAEIVRDGPEEAIVVEEADGAAQADEVAKPEGTNPGEDAEPVQAIAAMAGDNYVADFDEDVEVRGVVPIQVKVKRKIVDTVKIVIAGASLEREDGQLNCPFSQCRVTFKPKTSGGLYGAVQRHVNNSHKEVKVQILRY